MFKRWRSHVSTVLMVVGVWAAVHFWQTRDIAYTALPDASQDWALKAPNAPDNLQAWAQQYPDRPTLVYVWATWCTICKFQAPTVQGLMDQGIPVVTVAMQSGTEAAVLQHLGQNQHAWPTVNDPSGQLATALGARSVPTWLVVNTNGQVVSSAVGFTPSWTLRLRLWWAQV
jgi:thiol-disulfide isomerase/thioredoxin